jgi:diguanylate cyclase (GGDEF)-like protein
MQEDDTVLRLAHKSMAMSALSFIDSRTLPPPAVMEPFRDAPQKAGGWAKHGPLLLIPVLGLLGILPALLKGPPLAFGNAMAFVLIWLAVTTITLFARHGRRPQWTSTLRQMAWVLPAAIPILVFRPFDAISQVTAVALFAAWGMVYYLVPAEAPRLKLPLALAASAVFLAASSLIAAATLLVAAAQAIPLFAAITLSVVTVNVLGAYFSRLVQRLSLQTRVQRHLIDLLRDELNTLAETDELTGLASRKRVLEILQRHWEQQDSDPVVRQLALIMVDVDYLAELNEHYGRHIGDVCLTRIASQLRTHMRGRADCVARYAGTTFLLVLQGCDERRAVQVGEKIRRAVESMNMLNPKSPTGWVVTVSVGVCGCVPRAGYGCADAIQDVKSILARAKSSGRNRVYSRQGMESGARAAPHASPGDITQIMGHDTTLRRHRASLQVIH